MSTSSKKSPFTRYAEGYVDGYEGREMMLKDADYVRGYREGREDDSTGAPNKFARKQ